MTVPSKFAQFSGARPDTPNPMRMHLRIALIDMAFKEPDPVERAAKLAILKKDGWI